MLRHAGTCEDIVPTSPPSSNIEESSNESVKSLDLEALVSCFTLTFLGVVFSAELTHSMVWHADCGHRFERLRWCSG